MMNNTERLLDEWLVELRSTDHAPQTALRYGGIIRQFIQWFEEQEKQSLSLSDLTPITLISYRTSLQKIRLPATVNVHISALRAWCIWLWEHHYLTTNPALHLKQIERGQSDSPNGLKDTEINALLRATERSRHPKRDYAIVQVLLQTGMRIGECQNLSWEDITFHQKKGTVLIRAGKGNKSRTVPLNVSVRVALIAYAAPVLNIEAKAKDVAAAWPKQQADQPPRPLWYSQKGNRLSSPAMWRVINNLVRDCAVRELIPANTTPHWLRHTFARRYLKQYPSDLVGLARLLGHSNLNTTKIYTQPTPEELAERVDQLPLNAYG